MKKLSKLDACRRFRSFISELMAHEATPEVCEESEQHQAACSECASEYQLAVQVEQGLGILPELDPRTAPGPKLAALMSGGFEVARAASLAFDPTQPVELSMGCREFTDMLADFVSEALPAGTMLDAVEHASACRPCGNELTAMATMQDACRKLAEVEPPASILTSLMARIEAEEAAAGATESETVEVKKTSTARAKLLPVLG